MSQNTEGPTWGAYHAGPVATRGGRKECKP